MDASCRESEGIVSLGLYEEVYCHRPLSLRGEEKGLEAWWPATGIKMVPVVPRLTMSA